MKTFKRYKEGGQLEEKEAGIINIIRMNSALGIKYDFNFKIILKNIEIQFEQRSKNNIWGRFGGGWNRKLGIQRGRTTAIISFFIMTITIRKRSQ